PAPLAQNSAPPAVPTPAPQTETKTAETQPGEARASAPKPVETKPNEAGAVDNPAVTLSGGGQVRVTITADEAVWLLARADGKYAFSTTMDAHTTRTVEAAREVTLRLGNAGGVTITLNGKP